jgi:pimeloyl-ACP methyl ester carboxylesterase
VTEDRDRTLLLPDGRLLGYAEWGDPGGPPVLYFHGTPASRLDPVCFAEAPTEAGVRLISVDRPGMGLSSFQRHRKISQWPVDVAALAEALKLERFGVVGWSGGGPYVLACAAQLPDRLTGAISVAGVGRLDGPDAMAGMNGQEAKLTRLCLKAPPVARIVLGIVLKLSRAKPEQAFNSFRSEVSESDQQAIDALPAEAKRMGWFIESGRQGAKGPVHDYRALGDWGFRVEDVRAPVSVWQGDADQLVPMRQAEALVAAAPGARLRACPGEGHLIMVSHAGEILRAATREDPEPAA